MPAATPVRTDASTVGISKIAVSSPGATFVRAAVRPANQQQYNNGLPPRHNNNNNSNQEENALPHQYAHQNQNNSSASASSSSTALNPNMGITVEFQDGLALTTIRQIGKGGFASVYLAKAHRTNEEFALKIIHNITEGTWQRIQDEVRLLQMFRDHKNIVQLYAASRVENQAYLAMELLMERNLHEVITLKEGGGRMPVDEIMWIGNQLCRTLLFVHSRGCIHRDLKPANILFDKSGNVKLIDFGLASRVTDPNVSRATVAGTAIYMAPQLAAHFIRLKTKTPGQLNYGSEIDAWSFGMVLFVMATAQSPYYKANTHPDKEQRQMKLFEAVSGADWSWPDDEDFSIDPDLKDLIEQLLARNSAHRMSLESCLNHSIWRRCPTRCPDSLKFKLQIGSNTNNVDSNNNNNNNSNQGIPTPLRNRTSNNNSISASARNNNNTNNRSTAQQQQQNQDAAADGAVRYRSTNNIGSLIPSQEQLAALQNGLEQFVRIAVNLSIERSSQLAVFDEHFTLGLQELNHRKMVMDAEVHDRTVLLRKINNIELPKKKFTVVEDDVPPQELNLLMMNNNNDYNANRYNNRNNHQKSSSSRAMSIALPDNTKPLMSDFRRQRGQSIVPVFDNDGIRYCPVSPENEQQQNPPSSRSGRNTTNRRDARRSVSLAEAEEVNQFILQQRDSTKPISTIPKCMNGHILQVHQKLPFTQDGWTYEKFQCNSCNKIFERLGRGDKCILRCGKCDFDICGACVEACRRPDTVLSCLKCNKVFPSEAKLKSHNTNCRGVSVSPSRSPARDYAKNTLIDTFLSASRSSSARSSTTSNQDVALPVAGTTNNIVGRNTRDARSASAASSITGLGGIGRLSLGAISNVDTLTRGEAVIPPVPLFDDERDDNSNNAIIRRANNNMNRSASASSNTSSASTSSANNNNKKRRSVTIIEMRVEEDASPEETKDDEDLSPIQRAIQQRHRDNERRSQSLSASNFNTASNNNTQQNQPRGSVLPKAADMFQFNQQQQGAVENNNNNSKSPRLSVEEQAKAWGMTYPEYIQFVAENGGKNGFLGGRASQGRSSRSAARRSVSMANPTNDGANERHQRSFRKIEDEEENDQQQQQQQVKNVSFKTQQQQQPQNNNNMMMMNNQNQNQNMFSNNNMSGFNGPLGRYHDDNEQQQQIQQHQQQLEQQNNNNNARRLSSQSGPFFVRVDRNGNTYFVDANGQSVDLGINTTSNNNSSNNSASRSRGNNQQQKSQPSAQQQQTSNFVNQSMGPASRRGGSQMNQGVIAPSNGRAVSRPADPMGQGPVRDANGRFIRKSISPSDQQQPRNMNNNQMMMMAPQQQQTSPQQQQGAFLALPRRDDQRQRFVGEFLSGAWVRHYAFATNDVAFLYYCLQPGRYGAIYQHRNQQTNVTHTATVVIDIHTKLVLYVPSLRGESNARRMNGQTQQQRHRDIHVDTEYDDDARVMPLVEAQRYAGRVIGGILDYVNEITRAKSAGEVPVYVPSAHIQNASATSVPANTQFVYMRRVFPDPGSCFALFRLSNMRSQIICNANYDFDIRWQSDRNSNRIGIKYYVKRGGVAEPFQMDTSGLLARVEKVLSDQFSNNNSTNGRR